VSLIASLVHPWPYALWDHCLPSPSARESSNYRQGNSGIGETSLVREPLAGELQDVPAADRDIVLFMQAARWPDDIRRTDQQYHRGPWHYINWPFKPDGQPASVQPRDAEPVNILTALAENEAFVKNANDPGQKAIALAWLFHLVGDIHQPLHAAQIFTVDYPNGDKGENEICIRVTQDGQPMNLHRFWDGATYRKPHRRRHWNVGSMPR
jgi:S1/P1 Nuclease